MAQHTKNLRLLIGIGDLHGMETALFSLLSGLDSNYKIFSSKDKLKAGVKIVTTGDYTDRNPGALKIIEKIKKIQEKSPEKIVPLIGNHEIMALKSLDYAKEVSENSSENPLGMYYRCMHGYNGGIEFISEFDSKNQANALRNYVQRMKRSGDIGSWLRELLPYHLEKINGKRVLFTHADIPMELWNAQKLKEYLEEYLRVVGGVTTATYSSEAKYGSIEGPLWERIFSTIDNTKFKNMINSLNIDYLVTGHTPTDYNKIKVYADCVFDIDVGMWYSKESDPVAIVFKKEGIYEFNAKNGERVLIN